MSNRHIRLQSVLELTCLGRSTIYLLMSRGHFPRPVKLTAKAVAWREQDVLDWLASRPIAKASAKTPPQ